MQGQRRSFARTIGHAISAHQKNLLLNNEAVDINEFLLRPFEKWYLEIGFGSGENLLNLARNNPTWGFIGVEPFVNGAVKVINKIVEEKINNIFVSISDINDFLQYIPDKKLNQILILFPDPWPKKKQQKRRLVTDNFILQIQKKLYGSILFGTDDAGYFDQVINACQALKTEFKVIEKPSYLIESKYERKALEAGRIPQFTEISSNTTAQ